MVINLKTNRRPGAKQAASLTTEMMVALGILVIAMMPLALSFVREHKVVRSAYQQGIAMEIIDGEMEILAAGEWRAFPQGSNQYILKADSAVNLPAGKAWLTIKEKQLRLEWIPEGKGFRVLREAAGK